MKCTSGCAQQMVWGHTDLLPAPLTVAVCAHTFPSQQTMGKVQEETLLCTSLLLLWDVRAVIWCAAPAPLTPGDAMSGHHLLSASAHRLISRPPAPLPHNSSQGDTGVGRDVIRSHERNAMSSSETPRGAWVVGCFQMGVCMCRILALCAHVEMSCVCVWSCALCTSVCTLTCELCACVMWIVKQSNAFESQTLPLSFCTWSPLCRSGHMRRWVAQLCLSWVERVSGSRAATLAPSTITEFT